jgi:GT2 family glycosyltransferase
MFYIILKIKNNYMNKKNILMPKVLICAPQNENKNYVWDKWISNVRNFTYPKDRLEIFIADNSISEDNCNKLKFQGIKSVHTPQHEKGLLYTINDSHEACRQYAMKNGFDFMLHLETDIIPPIDVIERLMNNNKKVCAGVYDLFYGYERRPMIQLDEDYDRNVREYRNPEFVTVEEPLFFDGKVKQVYHAGLGCVLIHKSVFERIEFRVDERYDFHTDTWFANDCYLLNINIYADTNIQCEHYNGTWLGIKEIK